MIYNILFDHCSIAYDQWFVVPALQTFKSENRELWYLIDDLNALIYGTLL